MKPPFRADHVGSLLRPQELHAARARHKKGELDHASLRAVEDKCITDAVKLQEEVGLQAVTDGEFRRDWWHIDFIHGFDGVELTENKFATFHGTGEQPPLFKVTGKIRRSKPSMLDHFKFLKSVVKKGTIRIWTIYGPTSPRPIAKRSAISTRPAAATCRSTTLRSPCGATLRCRSSSASSATIRRRTRRCTPTR